MKPLVFLSLPARTKIRVRFHRKFPYADFPMIGLYHHGPLQAERLA